MKILSFDIGIINLAYCILDTDKNIHAWENITLCNGTEIENTVDLARKLDERPEILDVELVLLEYQPKMNPKMKVMAESVRSYLIFRGKIDRDLPFKIKNYSPKHKLKCWDGDLPEELIASSDMLYDKSKSGNSKMYRLRKKQAVYQCKMLVSEYEDKKWLDFFELEKKKDDLADCYLQALSYILYESSKKQGLIVARKPTKKQVKYNKYSKSNLKFLLNEHLEKGIKKFIDCDTDCDIVDWIKSKTILKSVKRLYGVDFDVEEIKKELLKK